MSELNLVLQPLFWLFAACATLAFALAALSVTTIFSFKKRLADKSVKLDRQLLMLQTGVQGMGKRVLELEDRLAGIRKSQEDLSSSSQDFAYSKARDLILAGMSDDAIAETSGLTPSEVGLMKLVQTRPHEAALGA